MAENKTVREPLFHVVKRTDIDPKKHALISASALVISLLLSSIVCSLVSEEGNPVYFFEALFEEAFVMNPLTILKDAALIMGVSLALVPAFRMKFWNLGGNGQILVGALAAIIVIDQLSGTIPGGIVYNMNHDAAGQVINEVVVPTIVINILSLIAGVLAGAIWAVIPAIFKAFFNTNESLFTLMMNYIASGLVPIYIAKRMANGQTTFPTIEAGYFPDLGHPVVIILIVVALLTAFISVYLKYSKHGYELIVVGESQNTAKYIGINVKKVIIRTVVLSGAICGLIGVLLVGCVSPTIGINTANNMGFTAIMTSWLGGFNPVIMIITSLFVSFITTGMVGVRTEFHITNNGIINFVVGIIYFFVIGAEFFAQYQLKFRAKKAKKAEIKADNKEKENK
ncbi:MAG: ABC transporter permease [Clostridia bacterium]|nr:ABC transporter permease [Clostridia bacterium]